MNEPIVLTENEPASKESGAALRADAVPPTTTPITEKSAVERAYRLHLEAIWASAHRDASADPAEWEMFMTGVLHAIGDPARLVTQDDIQDAQETGDSQMESGPLQATPGPADLLIRQDLRRLSQPAQIEAYVRRRIAPTIAVWERSGIGTREQRVDTVLPPIGRLAGRPGVVRLAKELFRYLQGQPPSERTPGFYTTVAALAGLVRAGRNTAYLTLGLELYHQAFKGAWSLAASGVGVTADDIEFIGAVAGNVAAITATQQQTAQVRMTDEIRTPLADILTISAVVSDPIDIDRSIAAALTEALGLGDGSALDVLTVLLAMARVSSAWATSHVDLARLEASGAVAWAADEPQAPNAVAGFFNGGLSLDRAGEDPALTQGEVLLYTLGLRLAIAQGSDLVDSLLRLHGLSCAVNLVGTVATEPSALPPQAIELARQLAGLARWQTLAVQAADDPSLELDLARLSAATERLKIDDPPEVDGTRLLRAVQGAVTALRAPTEGGEPEDDLLVDTAVAIRELFVEIIHVDKWSLAEQLKSFVMARQAPVPVFVERYRPYVGIAGGAGAVAMNAAGISEPADWTNVAAELAIPLDSIEGALANFRLD